MSRLLIRPSDCDMQTDRVTAALASRPGTTLYTLRHDHPASLMLDAIRLRRTASEASVVHAFGGRALAVALLATRGRLVFSPSGFPSRMLIRWLRAAMNYRTIEVVCDSDTARRALVTRGVAAERCHTIRPGVNMSAIPTTRDRSLRQKLGFTDDDLVLFAPLEITNTSGHRISLWSGSLLNVIDKNRKLLVWGHGPRRLTVDHLHSRLIDPSVIIVATDIDSSLEIEQLFGAADIILLTPSGPVEPLTIAMSMASNRPIIGTATPQMCELLEDRHTALLVPNASPKLVSWRMADLLEDSAMGWQIKDRARAEAYDHLTQAKMLELYRQFYANVEGSRQDVASPTLVNPSEA